MISLVDCCQSSKTKRKRDDVFPATETFPKPLIKWVGGKTQILEKIIKKFPAEIENYYEPFVGGGSVLLALLNAHKQGTKRVTGTIHASDSNDGLIGFYRVVQNEPDSLLEYFDSLVAECPRFKRRPPVDKNAKKAKRPAHKKTTQEEAQSSAEEYYYWKRDEFNALTKEEKQTPSGAAVFLFLNKTCYRGAYREGPEGCNIPYGWEEATVDGLLLRHLYELLQPVVFHTRSFSDLSPSVLAPGDFLYLDPPYVGSVHKYTKEGFTDEDHEKLFRLCHEIKDKGINLLMSNALDPFVQERFDSRMWTIDEIKCLRKIHPTNPAATEMEVLIS
jgi:DNA adenine methylase